MTPRWARIRRCRGIAPIHVHDLERRGEQAEVAEPVSEELRDLAPENLGEPFLF